MKRLRLWLALLFASICYLQGAYAGDFNEDYTHYVGTGYRSWDSYLDTENVPLVTTSDGRTVRMVEDYSTSSASIGVVLSQTVDGLPNGTYTVVLYANAFNTSERDTDIEPVEDGATDVAYVFAGEKQEAIIASNAINSETNGEYTIKDVIVSDGTLTLGLGKWKEQTNWHTIQIKSLILTSQLITVNLLEPGSLGTEILYNVDHLKDVHALKIVGDMNDDDLSKIKMMDNLVYLDMKETSVKKIPDNMFEDCNNHLKDIVLPEKLESIGQGAFYYSPVKNVTFFEAISVLGKNAFTRSGIKNAYLPNVNTITYQAFLGCENLESVIVTDKTKVIGTTAFQNCTKLKNITMQEGLTTIEGGAFQGCTELNTRIPSTVESIGEYAFSQTSIDSVVIAKASIGGHAFHQCSNLVYAEFPTNFHNINADNILSYCSNLNEVVLKSPTVVGNGSGYSKSTFLYNTNYNLKIVVPDYLINSYKLDEYWYNYTLEGFSTEEIDYWNIKNPLVLDARSRLLGNPTIKISETGSLKINGETGMDINDLYVDSHGTYEPFTSKLIVNNDGVKINGKLQLNYCMSGLKWYFISLPFDIKVSDIVTGGKYAIRYYDGAGRAQNGATGNWKNYEADDIIEAGTGFIYQTSQDGWTTFVSLDNESKQNIASNKMFVKALEANPSEKNSNKGWNLVGNPWQAYFNNHSVNFTAPITVWNGSTYVAYSLIDDDYAIKPNEAFFVQCPEEINSISFPITGRQMTSEITNQSGAKPRMFGANLENRQLIDLSVAKGDLMDKTRVVVNEGALADYETGVDASKFFSMDGTVPQVYTLVGEATECAINERPVAEGLVKVGFMAPEEGSYTFALVRNEAKTVVLIDHETGTTTDLTAGEYNFTAAQGTWNNRFELMITPAEPTAIEGVDGNKEAKVAATDDGIVVEGTEGRVVVYSVDGKKVAEQPVDGIATISVAKGTYLVRTTKGTAKVTVR